MSDCDRRQIRKYALAALRAGHALGRIPTPLDDITAAVRLAPVQPLFDDQNDHADMPPGLLARIRRLSGKVLGALALRERTIYVDRSQTLGRQHFAHGHELGHEVLPWHHDAYFGDDELTLHPETKELLEAEASFFSSDVLFQLDRFSQVAEDYSFGLPTPLQLSDEWETSKHATIRRYVEGNHRECGLLVLGHFTIALPAGGVGLKVIQGMESAAFRERYGAVVDRFPAILPVEPETLSGHAYSLLTHTAEEAILYGDNVIADGDRFEYELCFNGFFVFALVYPRRRVHLPRRVRVEWSGIVDPEGRELIGSGVHDGPISDD